MTVLDENGMPMMYGDDQEKTEKFNIDDRSTENEQLAVSELKKEFGPSYESAVKNARAVLKWADGEYPKALESSGLGNYPPLIIALNKLGKKLEVKYHEANNAGTTKEASLKAFHLSAREQVNHLITKIENEYIEKHGSISR